MVCESDVMCTLTCQNAVVWNFTTAFDCFEQLAYIMLVEFNHIFVLAYQRVKCETNSILKMDFLWDAALCFLVDMTDVSEELDGGSKLY